MIKFSKIALSLNYGWINTVKSKYFLRAAILLAIAFCLISILIIVGPLIGQFEWDKDITQALLFSIALCFIFLAIALPLILRKRKLKKKIDVMLQDAVMLKAQTKKVDSFCAGYRQPTIIKIHVKFKYNGKRFIRASNYGQEDVKGYDKRLKKYADKEVDILYSPKYDEVFICRRR